MNHSLYCNADGFSKIQFQMSVNDTVDLFSARLIFYFDQAGCVQGVRHMLCVVTRPHVEQVETDVKRKYTPSSPCSSATESQNIMLSTIIAT